MERKVRKIVIEFEDETIETFGHESLPKYEFKPFLAQPFLTQMNPLKGRKK